MSEQKKDLTMKDIEEILGVLSDSDCDEFIAFVEQLREKYFGKKERP